MHKEFASGAVIFRREGKDTYFLIVFSGRNERWGFPKGHIEKGEQEKETALREIEEETGLTDLRFFEGFREEAVYEAVSNRGKFKGEVIEKHAILFLCETTQEEVQIDHKEIVGFKWLPAAECSDQLYFENLKKVLQKAVVHMESSKY